VFCANDPVNSVDPFGLSGFEGGSGDVYRPDPFGHGVDPRTGKPLDPHLDRITPGSNQKYRYDPTGAPRGNAPKVPRQDLRAFGRGLSKLGSILSKFQEIWRFRVCGGILYRPGSDFQMKEGRPSATMAA
jgi:hypothetical protein